MQTVTSNVQTVTSRDGTRIAYEMAGTGPAVVLVDGAFCFRASGVTPKLMPLLSQHFTVYAYDRRGRGDSGNTEPYAVEREIEDLQAIMNVAGESGYVLAFSSGAGLALQAVARGLRPKKLTLYEPPYVATENDNPAQWREVAKEIQCLVADGRRSEAVSTFMTRIFGAPSFFAILMRLIARDSWSKNESVAHTLPYDIEIMGDYSVPKDVAAGVATPTAVMGGEKSPAKLRGAVEATARAIRGGRGSSARRLARSRGAPPVARWGASCSSSH